MINKINFRGKLLLVILMLFIAHKSFPQKADSLKMFSHFGGSVTLTNNGISTIPSFTLGKPAIIFAMSAGKKISFEPEWRFSLDMKPWMLIFWVRYDLLKMPRHLIRLGINTQFNFSSVTVTSNGMTNELKAASRWLTGDLSQNFLVSRHYSAGIYYMYSFTLENATVEDLHYLAFRHTFSNINLPGQFHLRFVPQIYYLRLGTKDGFYVSETLTLAKRNLPLSVSSIITNPIKTGIPVNNHLLWNINLIYAFNNEYAKRK